MLIGIKEAALILNVKMSWLRYKVFKRQIAYRKVGRHIRFEIDDLKGVVELKEGERVGGQNV